MEVAVAVGGSIGQGPMGRRAAGEEGGYTLRERAADAGGWGLPNAVSFGEVLDRDDDVARHGAEQRAEASAAPESAQGWS